MARRLASSRYPYRASPAAMSELSRGQLRVVPDLLGELGDAHLRVVGVALDLAHRHGGLGDLSVGEQHRVPGVLPGLVAKTLLGARGVLDVAVSVPVAVAVDPLER